MFEKLEALKSRYEELTTAMAEPEVVQWMQASLQEELEPILGGITR